MSSKQLTAKVRLNATQFESTLDALIKKINTINSKVNALGSNSKVANTMHKAEVKAEKLKQELAKTQLAQQKVATETEKTNFQQEKVRTQVARTNNELDKANAKINNNSSKTMQWGSKQQAVLSIIRSSNSALGSVGSKLKGILATYLGIMGAKTTIGLSDTITAAQNKLNYVNSQQLGDSAYNSDGSYSTKVFDASKESMDKMYNSAQKVRIGYTDMMSNVSKSMALAGKSFQNNTDNAIRFQEIMAEAYAVGGASQQEMHSSMYQMIQALGSGTLAGDELRSVREGAPLAYQAIEEFAQGIYDTEESLKDLASQGKITSDMVVAAVMNAGDRMDDAFAKTKQTFSQTWTQIKNMATQAFRPISELLNNELQKAVDSGFIEKLEGAFTTISNVLQIMFTLIINGIKWIAENWEIIKSFVIPGLITMAILMVSIGVISAVLWAIQNAWLVFFAIAIYSVVKLLYDMCSGVYDLSTAIVGFLAIVAIGLVVLAMITGNFWIAIAGIIVGVLAIALAFFEYVAGGCAFLGAVIWDILLTIWNIFWFVIDAILKIIVGAISIIINIVVGCINSILELIWAMIDPIISIVEWILNVYQGGFDSFGGAVANLIGQIIGWFLNLGKVVTKIIDAIFGTNWTSGLESLKQTVTAWGKNDKAITIERKAPEISRMDVSDTVNKATSWVPYTTDYANPVDWYDKGYEWGSDVKEWINSGGDKVANWYDEKFNLDNLKDKLGLDNLDLLSQSELFPDTGNVADAYSMPTDLLSGIKDDTGSISDSMDLTDEDLDYLRKIAEMEWRKEFTTAEIKVDMSNYNTIQGERDLDGIVDYLSDVLRSEMTSVAEGVHY